jgi:hypothetical protein
MRSAPAIFTILGLGLGVLLFRSRARDPMPTMTLRERAIEAQKISARTSQIARDLAERWSATAAESRIETFTALVS